SELFVCDHYVSIPRHVRRRGSLRRALIRSCSSTVKIPSQVPGPVTSPFVTRNPAYVGDRIRLRTVMDRQCVGPPAFGPFPAGRGAGMPRALRSWVIDRIGSPRSEEHTSDLQSRAHLVW